MTISSEFHDLTLEELLSLSKNAQTAGWRFVQMLAVAGEETLDLIYSFFHDDVLDNYVVRSVTKDTAIPSISGEFPAAFVFENEAHDLFGAHIKGISIDFEGNFYALAQAEPMTIVSPERLAERDKQKKLAAAQASKAAKAACEATSTAKEGD